LNVDDPTDQTRFAEVFLPHLVDAYRLARWLAGSGADAEDIVQEAALRAFKAIRSFSGSNARAWVLTIVRNTSYSWLAKNRPRVLVLREIHDLDYRTIAEIIQAPIGTVMSRLARARKLALNALQTRAS
jgi:DNA-directed RNA polymerase specialized sigma24 family protein